MLQLASGCKKVMRISNLTRLVKAMKMKLSASPGVLMGTMWPLARVIREFGFLKKMKERCANTLAWECFQVTPKT